MLIAARVLIGTGTSAGYPAAMVIIRRRATGATIAGMATVAVGPPARNWLILARMLPASRVRMVTSGLALTAAPQNEQL